MMFKSILQFLTKYLQKKLKLRHIKMVFGLNTSPLYRQIEQIFDAAELEITNSTPDND